MEVSHAARVVVVGIAALGRLAPRAIDLGTLRLRSERTGDALGHLILQLEDVAERAFEPVGSRTAPGGGMNELSVIRTRLAALAEAALQDAANAQFAPHPLHVRRLSPVGKARVARDDEQLSDVRQRR